jgi:hypothetical protein
MLLVEVINQFSFLSYQLSPNGVAGKPTIVEGRSCLRILTYASAYMNLPDFIVEEDDREPNQAWDHEVREGKHSCAKDVSDPRNVDNNRN